MIVGYCAAHTYGGQLRDGKKELFMFGQKKKVRAAVHTMESFSAHADRHEIYNFLQNQRPSLKKLFLVHGDYRQQKPFKAFLEERGFENIEIPTLGQEFELS